MKFVVMDPKDLLELDVLDIQERIDEDNPEFPQINSEEDFERYWATLLLAIKEFQQEIAVACILPMWRWMTKNNTTPKIFCGRDDLRLLFNAYLCEVLTRLYETKTSMEVVLSSLQRRNPHPLRPAVERN